MTPPIRPTAENPTPGLRQEILDTGQATMPDLEISVGAMKGSVILDWATPRAWISMQPEAVPSFISAILSATLEAMKHVNEEEVLKQKAEREREERKDDQW